MSARIRGCRLERILAAHLHFGRADAARCNDDTRSRTHRPCIDSTRQRQACRQCVGAGRIGIVAGTGQFYCWVGKTAHPFHLVVDVCRAGDRRRKLPRMQHRPYRRPLSARRLGCWRGRRPASRCRGGRMSRPMGLDEIELSRVDAANAAVSGSPGMPAFAIIADGLDFPTSVAVTDDGAVYVAESGLPFGGAKPGGRIVRIGPKGTKTTDLEGLRQPVNGLTWHDGTFYISEGGFPGRISRWRPGGERETILDGLPGRGNYHTNMVAVGPGEWLYFSQGAMTNSGVVGLDAYELAWLKQ